MTPIEIKNIIEFALLTAGEPLDMGNLRRLLAEDASAAEIRQGLSALEAEWSGRSLRLMQVADGYQLVSREGYVDFLRRMQPKKTARLSRSLLEVLAIIAYQQPTTRGDIEQIRGVSVSSVQLATLEEFGWIEEMGRRETPGRPILYGTTKTFLNDLAIASLDDLPTLEQEDINAAIDLGDSEGAEETSLKSPADGELTAENSDADEAGDGKHEDEQREE